MSKSARVFPVYEKVVEQVMHERGRGVCVRFTGTKFGLSYDDWSRLICAELREPMYGTPRCTRLRAFDVDQRIAQIGLLQGAG